MVEVFTPIPQQKTTRVVTMQSSDDDFINPPNNPADEETSKRTRDEDNEQITKGRKKMKKVGVLNIFNFFCVLTDG